MNVDDEGAFTYAPLSPLHVRLDPCVRLALARKRL